jgi:2-oxoglutarate ferredoxin oxidoreductase subunit beta
MMLNNEVYGMTGGQVSPTTSSERYTTTTPYGNHEPVFDACALAEAAGAGMVGRELTLQTPGLKDVLKAGLAHDGFSFIEVMSDCTEVFGRKNELGNSAEMVLTQKASVRPDFLVDAVDQPFRPHQIKTGVLAKKDRPEYAASWRSYVETMKREHDHA